MNDPMRILKADHREVEQLLTKLADSDEGPEREAMVEELTLKLTAHMEAEESIVYPPVRTEVGEEDEEEAEIEHNLAREGLQKLQAMLEMPGFGAAVEMLKGGISHHVEEEESQLLPELRDSLEREEWLAIGDALAEAKEAIGLPVPQPPRRRSEKRRSGSTSSSARKSSAAKKSSARKSSSAKKSTAKKSTAKKSAAKKSSSARKAPAKKAASRR